MHSASDKKSSVVLRDNTRAYTEFSVRNFDKLAFICSIGRSQQQKKRPRKETNEFIHSAYFVFVRNWHTSHTHTQHSWTYATTTNMCRVHMRSLLVCAFVPFVKCFCVLLLEKVVRTECKQMSVEQNCSYLECTRVFIDKVCQRRLCPPQHTIESKIEICVKKKNIKITMQVHIIDTYQTSKDVCTRLSCTAHWINCP